MKNITVIATIATAILFSVTAALAEHEHAKAQPRKSKEQVVTIDVTSEGFVPAKVEVKAGRPVKLVVTRKTDRTCAKEIVVKDYGINQPLPLNQPVEVAFTPKKTGQIRYACAMDMIAGVIIVD